MADINAIRKSAITSENSARTLVAIGASAGGLDACTRLVSAIPTGHGIAMILVQHLVPNHDSLMVSPLVNNTEYVTKQAFDGAEVPANHLYIIPPGQCLTVDGGRLHLEPPREHHKAHFPFDVRLFSLAAEAAPRWIGIVLSETGFDGTNGLKALRDAGGFCIAQDPYRAGYSAMPENAIESDAIDLISYRNLLIYLSPEAPAMVISVFHFALRADGVLLPGSAETTGSRDGQFELISKPEMLYLQNGPS